MSRLRYGLAALALCVLVRPAGAAETFTDLPADGTSTVAARVGPGLGFARLPRTFGIGVDYDLALSGPLQLHAGAVVGLAGDVLALRLAPGVRYLLPTDGLAWLPWVEAGLAVDLVGGSGAADTDLGVGLLLGAGLQYYFHRSLAVGPALSLVAGVASGDEGSGAAFGIDAVLAVSYRLQ